MAISEKQNHFLQIYDQYADAIFRHCCYRISHREKAKDLTQEVFLKFWKYLEADTPIAYPKNLLYQIANNAIIDEYRKQKNLSLETLQKAGFDPVGVTAADLAKNSEIKEFITLLQKIEVNHKDLIIMKYIDDLSVKEIAALTGETENVISVRLHRSLEKIRMILNQNYE